MVFFSQHTSCIAGGPGVPTPGCTRAWAVGCCLLFSGCTPPAIGLFQSNQAYVDTTETAFQPEPVVAGWPGLALADFDNDGDVDVFVTNVAGGPNLLYLNDGTGRFLDVGGQAGVRFRDDTGVAAGVGDFDNDGWLDLIIGRQINFGGSTSAVQFLKNVGLSDEGVVRFVDVTDETGLADVTFASSIGVGDIDNDGLLDLYIGRYDFRDLSFRFDSYLPDTPNVLMHNTGISDQGIPVFADITESAGVGGSRASGVAPDSEDIRNRVPTWAVHLSDVNEDGRLDLFALHELPGYVDLFINNGDTTFTRATADFLAKRGGWMGMAAADYDGNGRLDYFLTNVGADALGEPATANHLTGAWRRDDGSPFHLLITTDQEGELLDRTSGIDVATSWLPPENMLGGEGLQGWEFGFGCAWVDVQNDGWPDLTWTGDIILSGGAAEGPGRADFRGVSRLLVNNGSVGFRDESVERGVVYQRPDEPLSFGYARPGRALGAIDLNGDGLAEICRTALAGDGNAFQCLTHPGGEGGHWLTVRLVGSTANRFGIGARVEATAGDRMFVGEVLTTTSAFTAVHPQVQFGLGESDRVDLLEVHWPGGGTTRLMDVAVDGVLTIAE